jgi:hypothetical protein
MQNKENMASWSTENATESLEKPYCRNMAMAHSWMDEFSTSLVEFLFGIGSSHAKDCLSRRGQPL